MLCSCFAVPKVCVCTAISRTCCSVVLYTGVILSDESHQALLQRFGAEVPSGWRFIADHMTVCTDRLQPPFDEVFGIEGLFWGKGPGLSTADDWVGAVCMRFASSNVFVVSS